MIDFKYDFSFLLKMIKFVFLPILTIVILTAFIIFIYSRKVKKEDIKKYNYIIEFWTTFLAIWIIGALFAVTIGFSISLTNSIKMYNLMDGNEIVYYLVLGVPVIPLIFLCVYIYRIIIVLINKPTKEKNVEVPKDEIVPEPSVIDKDNFSDIASNDDFTQPLVFSTSNQINEEAKVDSTGKDNDLKQTEELDEKSEILEEENSDEIEVL